MSTITGRRLIHTIIESQLISYKTRIEVRRNNGSKNEKFVRRHSYANHTWCVLCVNGTRCRRAIIDTYTEDSLNHRMMSDRYVLLIVFGKFRAWACTRRQLTRRSWNRLRPTITIIVCLIDVSLLNYHCIQTEITIGNNGRFTMNVNSGCDVTRIDWKFLWREKFYVEIN